MVVSGVGICLIPLGAYLFLFAKRHLFWATVFSAPFLNSSVLYVKSISFYLQIPVFFMALLILRWMLDVKGASKQLLSDRSSLFLGLFVVFSAASLIMPILEHDRVIVHSINTPYIIKPAFEFPPQFPPKSPLKFGLINITQLGYLVFGACAFFAFKKELTSRTRVLRTLDGRRVYLAGRQDPAVLGVVQRRPDQFFYVDSYRLSQGETSAPPGPLDNPGTAAPCFVRTR